MRIRVYLLSIAANLFGVQKNCLLLQGGVLTLPVARMEAYSAYLSVWIYRSNRLYPPWPQFTFTNIHTRICLEYLFQALPLPYFLIKKKKLAENLDALLLTHKGFSGPAVLNLSRSISQGLCISVNYFPFKQKEIMIKELSSALTGNPKQILTLLNEYFNGLATGQPAVLPKRFLEAVCLRAGIDSATKASQLRHIQLQSFVMLLTQDRYRVEKTGGFEIAMVTSGGVELSEVNLKTMESKKYSGLYFAGEVLDVDGDTGGYNLQFAFSSGNLAANSLI